MKLADKNHLNMSRWLRQSLWQVRDKPICVALMEFWLDFVADTNHESPQHKSWNSVTWFVSQTFMIVRDKVHDFDLVAKSV